eukprot:scaffold23007_cov60-Phaeocystis_antarctica.AAC.4
MSRRTAAGSRRPTPRGRGRGRGRGRALASSSSSTPGPRPASTASCRWLGTTMARKFRRCTLSKSASSLVQRTLNVSSSRCA